jgi:hypothetical protein
MCSRLSTHHVLLPSCSGDDQPLWTWREQCHHGNNQAAAVNAHANNSPSRLTLGSEVGGASAYSCSLHVPSHRTRGQWGIKTPRRTYTRGVYGSYLILNKHQATNIKVLLSMHAAAQLLW